MVVAAALVASRSLVFARALVPALRAAVAGAVVALSRALVPLVRGRFAEEGPGEGVEQLVERMYHQQGALSALRWMWTVTAALMTIGVATAGLVLNFVARGG